MGHQLVYNRFCLTITNLGLLDIAVQLISELHQTPTLTQFQNRARFHRVGLSPNCPGALLVVLQSVFASASLVGVRPPFGASNDQSSRRAPLS